MLWWGGWSEERCGVRRREPWSTRLPGPATPSLRPSCSSSRAPAPPRCTWGWRPPGCPPRSSAASPWWWSWGWEPRTGPGCDGSAGSHYGLCEGRRVWGLRSQYEVNKKYHWATPALDWLAVVILVLRPVPGETVLPGDVFHVRGDVVDVPLQDSRGVGLRQEAVSHQSVAQQVLGVHPGDEGSGVREIWDVQSVLAVQARPAVLPTTCSSVTLSSVWNLGGPPLTSHLYRPLVARLMLFRMMWVGLLRSSTTSPDSRKSV